MCSTRLATLIQPPFYLCSRRTPRPTLFPYTTLFRSPPGPHRSSSSTKANHKSSSARPSACAAMTWQPALNSGSARSEEHTSELQSHSDLVCRLLLEKKNNHIPALLRIQVDKRGTGTR